MNRQCQLRLGPEIRYGQQAVIVDLMADPFRLIAGTWQERSSGVLETEVLLRAASLTELDGQAARIRRMLAFADAWSGAMQGRPVYVYHLSLYTHLRAHETDSYLVCRLLLEKKNHTSTSPSPRD